MFRKVKRILFGLMGFVLALSKGGAAQNVPVPGKPNSPLGQEQPAPAQFSKQELVSSLNELEGSPEDVQVISAMCYEISIPPEEVEFLHKSCGNTSIYSRETDQGAIIDSLPYIKRSLALMPYKISINDSGLCPTCGKGNDKVLVMTVSCFDCGKEFTWTVKDQEDVSMLRWLYVKPPITELDGNDLGIWDNDEEKIREGVQYIRDHVFCPVCREKINAESKDESGDENE